MQRFKDWIDRLLSYIFYLKDINENIYDNHCNILRPRDSRQNRQKLVDIWKWPFIQRSPFQHISSTLKQHLNENIGSWRKSFPFLLPLSWPSYIFVERLWPSRIASPTSRASSHLMACRVSDSSRSNCWAPWQKKRLKKKMTYFVYFGFLTGP